MAERMCVLFNDAKLMLSEVRHEHNWTARYYNREVGDVLWFFHGRDDRLFDFKKAMMRNRFSIIDLLHFTGIWSDEFIQMVLDRAEALDAGL